MFSFSFVEEYPIADIEPAHIVAPTAGESKASAICMVISPCGVTYFTLVARHVLLSSIFRKKGKGHQTTYHVTLIA
jgi:hypothetical protein